MQGAKLFNLSKHHYLNDAKKVNVVKCSIFKVGRVGTRGQMAVGIMMLDKPKAGLWGRMDNGFGRGKAISRVDLATACPRVEAIVIQPQGGRVPGVTTSTHVICKTRLLYTLISTLK